MTDYLLGIDIGTTSTKAVLIDAAGHIVATNSLPSDLSTPHPGWAEEDPDQWWSNIRKLVPALMDSAGIKPVQVVGIGISGMVPTLILLDQKGKLLRPSIQQNDARAVEEIEYQRSRTDESAILSRTGSAITQQSIGPKLLWLRQHEPEILLKARHVLGSYDYIVHLLTGEFSAERNWALESGFYTLQEEDWDESLLELAGINRSWLGALHRPADRVGELTEQSAAEIHLLKGTPVVAGSADHIASAFSAGVCQAGDLLVKLGGAGDILYCINRPELDARLYLDYHVMPGKFLVNGCMASSGSLIRWFRDQFAPDQDYAALDEAADQVPAGSDNLVILPYFLGEKTPINDPYARGTLIGLTLSHSKAHIYRAILEGIAYGFKDHLCVMAEHNLAVHRTRLTNGGARSRLWKQITADVLGLPMEEVLNHPGSSLGAAFIAGKGVGVFKDWGEIEKFIQVSTVIQPNRENYSIYQQLFDVYRSTYQSLKPIYPKLSI